MSEIKQQVTEEDVLRGSRTVTVETRDGTAAIHTMKGLADVAKVSGLGLSGMGAALAVVATVAYTAKVAMESFKASAQWNASSSALAGQMDAFGTGVGNKRDSLRDRIKGLQKTDSITPEWAGVLNKEISQGGTDAQVRNNLVWIKKNLDEIEAKAKIVGPALKEMTAMENALAIEVQTGFDRDREAARRNYMERLNQIEEIAKALDGANTVEIDNLRLLAAESLKVKEAEIKAAREAAEARIEKSQEEVYVWKEVNLELTENQKIAEKFKEEMANGLSREIVNAFRDGEFSAKKFGETVSNVLADIAQEILKVKVITPLINAGFALFGMANGGMAFAANGGMFPQFAANGLAGVNSVSSPTYFPKFNVVAGEAGREMLTVLARPRLMEVGGMQAVVGSAQGRQLAITSAADLARGGAGGVVDIRVTLGPELRAEIVNESVQGARVTVANDMRQDTPISRGVKGLTG